MAVASLMALASCSDDTLATYTVGEENNVLSLLAGVDNRLTANTRANESSYVALTSGTAARLRVEGTWKKSDTETKEIIQLSTATAAAEQDATKVNALTLNPQLYWDDYGTADPNNTDNRSKGLNIYGVAVDGLTRAPSVAYTPATTSETGGTTQGTDQWGSPSSETTESNTISWSTVDDDTSNQILNKDLLVSNNLSDEPEIGGPGRYTFTESKGSDATQSKLVFKHVFSKLTFNLKAADGFTDHKFQKNPTVTLTRSKYSETTKKNYCLTEGTVNIKSGKASASSTEDAKQMTAKVTGTSVDDAKYTTVKEEVVVYPATVILDNENDIVAMINADDNLYYVTAAQIKEAIDNFDALNSDSEKYKAKAGYNYVFNVTVNKTHINVTATVEDWTVVTADYEPKINITESVGTAGKATNNLTSFSFYRKSDEAGDEGRYGTKADGSSYYAQEVTASLSGSGTTKAVTFKDASDQAVNLYWPDHQTHYHFRGVYPQTSTETSSTSPKVAEYTVDSKTLQGIHVENQKYSDESMEAQLMIGAPEFTDVNKDCGNKDHLNGQTVDMSEHGICAREGTIKADGTTEGGVINLNFCYMMSQVVVKLSTTGGTDKVNLSSKTIVELEGAETQGYVGLHSRSMDSYDTGTNKGYTMKTSSTDLQRHDLIVPQSLNDLKFKISILDNNGNVTDIYRASIADVQVYDADASENKTGEAKKITAWESGKKYIYNLKLSKTKVNVTATLTDWTTKTADTEIWF